MDAPVMVFLCAQTLVAVWWASCITTRQEYLIEQVRGMKTRIETIVDSAYSAKDAEVDFHARDLRLDLLTSQINHLERNLKKNE